MNQQPLTVLKEAKLSNQLSAINEILKDIERAAEDLIPYAYMASCEDKDHRHAMRASTLRTLEELNALQNRRILEIRCEESIRQNILALGVQS